MNKRRYLVWFWIIFITLERINGVLGKICKKWSTTTISTKITRICLVYICTAHKARNILASYLPPEGSYWDECIGDSSLSWGCPPMLLLAPSLFLFLLSKIFMFTACCWLSVYNSFVSRVEAPRWVWGSFRCKSRAILSAEHYIPL